MNRRIRSCVFGNRPYGPFNEFRRIAAFWNSQYKRLIGALGSIEGVQFLAQQSRLRADDIIFIGIIIWRTLEDPLANSLFADLVNAIFQRTTTNIQQKVLQPRRFDELLAAGDSLRQAPARIHFEMGFQSRFQSGVQAGSQPGWESF